MSIRCMCGAETKLRKLREHSTGCERICKKRNGSCWMPNGWRRLGGWQVQMSHDLRHSLAAVLANAEFLCESNLTSGQREDLYAEIRIAVNQMTDLIESLLEFSRTRESLHPSYGDVRSAVDRAVQGVKAHPEFQRIRIRISGEGSSEGWFDFKKLERALLNLLLNACEMVPADSGKLISGCNARARIWKFAS